VAELKAFYGVREHCLESLFAAEEGADPPPTDPAIACSAQCKVVDAPGP
jgi:hypothetical protein